MNPKARKSKPPKKTAGTVLAEAMRAQGNKLSDAERDKLGSEFLELYYGGESKPASIRRR